MTANPTYPGALPRNTVRFRAWHFPLFVDGGQDLRRFSSIELLGIRPNGTTFGGVPALGWGEIHLPNQTMLEHQWAVYMVQEGDLSQVGTYTVQLQLSPRGLIEPPQATFQVIP